MLFPLLLMFRNKFENMIRTLKQILSIATIFAFVSCQYIGDTSENMADEFMIHNYSQKYHRKGIDRSTVVISAADARLVAERYIEGEPTVKSFDKSVKDVIPVFDKNGEPVIYAVNFDDGYIWISARTDYYPIVAEVENGHFSMDDLENGVGIMLRDISEEIEYVASLDGFYEYRNAWQPYMEGISCDSMISTKAWSVEEQIAYNLLTDRLHDDGYDYAFLMYSSPQSNMNLPEDVYSLFCEKAEMKSFGDEHIRDLAVVAKKHVEISTDCGPYIKTRWGQGPPFNNGLPDKDMPLGCVTLAVGQLMRYFEYPAYINWAGMSNVTASIVLVSFLTQLREELKVDDSGGSTIENAKAVLTDYGYSCEIIDHSVGRISANIKLERPVYMRGQSSSGGHAWICDGYRNLLVYDEYQLYTYESGVDGMEYFQSGFERKYTASYSTYHMNWGWRGEHDGWFADNDISTSVGNFNKKRKELIISGHN